jgi:hypothetical protein
MNVLSGTLMPHGLLLELYPPGFPGPCDTLSLQLDPLLMSNDHGDIITVIVTDLRHEPLEVWFDLITKGLRDEGKRRIYFGGKLAEVAGEHIKPRIDCAIAKGSIATGSFSLTAISVTHSRTRCSVMRFGDLIVILETWNHRRRRLPCKMSWRNCRSAVIRLRRGPVAVHWI